MRTPANQETDCPGFKLHTDKTVYQSTLGKKDTSLIAIMCFLTVPRVFEVETFQCMHSMWEDYHVHVHACVNTHRQEAANTELTGQVSTLQEKVGKLKV